ncbi:MAG: hypothetical protein IKO68_05340 [Oscillospiraceae bacterium]|nr:hypothetical protein [Oscillospiraceae bacterium]
MKKNTVRYAVIILVLSILLSTAALAAQESSAYIGATNAYFTRSGNNVNIYFSIVGRGLMNEIGVSEIYLYEKTGNTWNLVYIFDSNDSDYTDDMLSYDTTAKADHVTYSGSSSKDYLAILYFYAADDNGSDTIPYYSYS